MVRIMHVHVSVVGSLDRIFFSSVVHLVVLEGRFLKVALLLLVN